MYRSKRKRNIIIFSLVGVLLCMVAGYAAFQTQLKVTGSSTVTSNWDIEITNVTSGTPTGSAENAVAPSWDKLWASMEANLYDKGDAMEYDVTIENKGTLDAKLNDILTNLKNSNSDAVIITFSGYTKGEILKSKSTKVIHVKIEYNPNYDGGETSSEVEINFDYIQNNNETSPIEKTYLLTYDYKTNGGSNAETKDQYFVSESSVDLSNTATKEGWTFVGWNTNKDAEVGLKSYQMPESNTTLYAIYSKTLKVTYAKGENVNSIGKTNDSCNIYNNETSCEITLPSITPNDGYIVEGWYSGNKKIGSPNSKYSINNNLSLTSKVKQNTYTVTYDYKTNGGTSVTKESAKVNSGEDIDLSVSATKEGWTFVGWNTNKDATTKLSSLKMSNSNVTLYAIYKKEAKTITVTFNKNGAASQTPSSGSASTANTITQSCTIPAVYNNGVQATTCNITSPTINASANTPIVVGYNTSSSATSSSWNPNTLKAVSTNATYYAITRKDAITLTAKFNANGSSLTSTADQTCTINASYNGKEQATSCTVTAPTITRSGYTIIGYNTSAGSTTNNSSYNTSSKVITLTASNNNSTWYAITSKKITITFDKNGASAIGSTSQSCTMYNTATSCNVTSPSITASTNTPTVIGWSTAAGTHTNQWSVNTAKAVNANTTYYAQTSKVAKTVTITFNKNGAASQTPSGGSANTGATLTQSCTIAATYNGNAQDTTCNITSPTINASANTPTVIGYNISASGTSSAWNSNTVKSVSSNATYYAITRKDAVTLTAKFNANGSSLSSTSDQTCTLAATYNGKVQTTSCAVTTPTITRSGYTIIGYNTSAGSTANNSSYNATDKVITLTASNNNNTWYAITSKKITITFDKNGASAIGSTSQSCTMYNTAASCNVTSPTITAASGFGVLGWNTSSGSTASAWEQNTAKSFSANATYYAVTRSTSQLTASFNANGATIGSTSQSCYRYNGASSCNITTPSITRSGFTITGWGTNASATTAAVKASASLTLTANATYYAVTSKVVTVTFSKGSNVSAIGSTNGTCTIQNSAANCQVTLPSITANTGYTAVGWSTTNGATTGTAAGGKLTLSNNATYYANAVDKTAPTVSLNPNTQASYVAGGKAITVTMADSGSGIKASQPVYYAWSTSSTTAPTFSSSVTTTATAGSKSATVTIPATASSSLTGSYYLWIKSGISDVAGNTSAQKVSSVFKFDNKAPTLSISTTSTTKSITVVATASATSGITKYEYSKDGGKTWTTSTSKTYTFNSLTHATSYSIMVRITSGSGKTASTSKAVTTSTITKPTFKEATASGKNTITITYPSGCGSTYTCTYQKDNGSPITVTSTSTTVTFTANGSIAAKVSDGTNSVSSSYNTTIKYAITTSKNSTVNLTVTPNTTLSAANKTITFTVPSSSTYSYQGAYIYNTSGAKVMTLNSSTKSFTMPSYAVIIAPIFKYNDKYILNGNSRDTTFSMNKYDTNTTTKPIFNWNTTSASVPFYAIQASKSATDHTTLVDARGQATSAKTYNVNKYCALNIVYGGSYWAGTGGRAIYYGLIRNNNSWIHGATSPDYVNHAEMGQSNITYAQRKTTTLNLNPNTSGNNNYYIIFQLVTNRTSSSLDVFQIYFTGCTYYS